MNAPTTQQEQHYLDTRQAAAHLNVSTQFLEKARHFGEGPIYHAFTARCIRYLVDDLDAWAADRRRNSTKESEAA
jgi:hypothetical protein